MPTQEPHAEPPRERPLDEWREVVSDAERRGETLAAVDLAERGLEEHPDDLWLRHRYVLALARSGSTGEAARRFAECGLDSVDEEDAAALGARIAKDEALGAIEGRKAKAVRAAHAYAQVFSRTGGYYPAVNAATMYLVAGRPDEARTLAGRTLELVDAADDSYYAAATEAEAHLVLGEEAAASEALTRAAAAAAEDYGALATTRRQLKVVCDLVGADPGILGALAGPPVAHYSGPRPGNGAEALQASREADLATRMAAAIERHRPRFGYGSLAAGEEILWAESLQESGCDLHVILPFQREEFVRHAVVPAGAGWVERFEHCMASAREVRYATEDAYQGDDVLYRYGTELATGLAVLRARQLDAPVHELAISGADPDDGLPQTARQEDPTHPARVVRAMLFADVRGFSKLSDEAAPAFVRHVLGAFAEVLDSYGDAVWHRNTWGDAVYAVLEDAFSGADCALDLQEAMHGIDLAASGLPGHLALRMGAHVGPVFPMPDPVIGELGFMGSHVSRTARIEPVTPPGVVYVTEQFAAAVALDERGRFACDYVGHMPAAKDFGRLRMYRLRRADTEAAAGA